ncbi:MAG: hypothetical protein ACLFM0_11010, partial [Spirochaetales bacterium]
MSNVARKVLVLVLVVLPAFNAAADLEIESDRWNSVFADGRERTVLSGNARVRSDRFNITADEIELYGDDFRYVRSSGSFRIEELERGLVLTGGSLFVDRERDLMRVEGSAEMEDRENELIVRGGFLEFRGEEELTIVQIGVRILRDDLVTRSEFARYRRDADELELSGLPRIVWRDDEYSASRIVVDLDTDEINLRGEVQAELRTEEEVDEDEADEESLDEDEVDEEGVDQQDLDEDEVDEQELDEDGVAPEGVDEEDPDED